MNKFEVLRSSPIANRASRGFTLVELLVSVTVLATLAVAAIPPMQDLIRSARVVTASDQLAADIQVARREAIARNGRVLMCGLNSSGQCGTSTTWAYGWVVCYDNDGSGTCDVTATNNPNPIRQSGPPASVLTITGPATAMRFNADGTQGAAGAAALTLTVKGTWTGTKTYTTTIAPSGAVSTSKG